MNILVLCLSEGKGGLEFYISKMAKNINRVEHKLFFCVKPGSHLDGILNNEPGKIFYLTKTLTYFPLLSALRLAKIIDELSIDCLFLNWGADLPLAAMAKAMSKKKPKLMKYMLVKYYHICRESTLYLDFKVRWKRKPLARQCPW